MTKKKLMKEMRQTLLEFKQRLMIRLKKKVANKKERMMTKIKMQLAVEKTKQSQVEIDSKTWAENRSFLSSIDLFSNSDIDSGNTVLHQEARSNNVSFFADNTFYDAVDLDAKDIQGCSVLAIAVASSSLELVRICIEKGADIHTKDLKDNTLLHAAVKNSSHLRVLKLLVEMGLPFDATNNFGETPLHVCVSLNDMKAAKILLNCNPNTVIRNNNGKSALHLAISMKHQTMFELLVEHGCDLFHTTAGKQTPLMVAAQYDNVPVAKYILSQKEFDVNAKDSLGYAALYHAVRKNDGNVAIKWIDLLVANGADLNLENVTPFPHDTPMHIAVEKKSFGIARRMIQLGMNAINTKGDYGAVPIHKAIFNCSEHELIQWIDFLVGHGADLEVQTHFSESLLHITISKKMFRATRRLFHHGIKSVNTQDEWGQAPIHKVMRYCHKNNVVKWIDLLVANGANLNLRTCFLNTPLHIAAQKNCIEGARRLIHHHGLISDYMVLRSHKEIKSFGIDRDLRYEDTPLHIAARSHIVDDHICELFYNCKNKKNYDEESVREEYDESQNVVEDDSNDEFQTDDDEEYNNDEECNNDEETRNDEPEESAKTETLKQYSIAMLDLITILGTGTRYQNKSKISKVKKLKNNMISILLDFGFKIDAISTTELTPGQEAMQAKNFYTQSLLGVYKDFLYHLTE
jgi:ankyrin repeat protein